MNTYQNQSSYLANSSKKNFKLGLLLAIAFCIVAFKLPFKSAVVPIVIPPLKIEETGFIITQATPPKPKLPIIEHKIPPPIVAPSNIITTTEETATDNMEDLFKEAEEIKLPSETKIVESTPPVIKSNKPLIVADEMPHFNGGIKAQQEYFANIYSLPSYLMEEEGGLVYVRFTVTKDGSIKDAEIAGSKNPALNKYALNMVKNMPKWIPGKQNGIIVDVSLVLPINFVFR